MVIVILLVALFSASAVLTGGSLNEDLFNQDNVENQSDISKKFDINKKPDTTNESEIANESDYTFNLSDIETENGTINKIAFNCSKNYTIENKSPDNSSFVLIINDENGTVAKLFITDTKPDIVTALYPDTNNETIANFSSQVSKDNDRNIFFIYLNNETTLIIDSKIDSPINDEIKNSLIFN